MGSGVDDGDVYENKMAGVGWYEDLGRRYYRRVLGTINIFLRFLGKIFFWIY